MRFDAMALAMLVGTASVIVASVLSIRAVFIFLLMAFTAVQW